MKRFEQIKTLSRPPRLKTREELIEIALLSHQEELETQRFSEAAKLSMLEQKYSQWEQAQTNLLQKQKQFQTHEKSRLAKVALMVVVSTAGLSLGSLGLIYSSFVFGGAILFVFSSTAVFTFGLIAVGMLFAAGCLKSIFNARATQQQHTLEFNKITRHLEKYAKQISEQNELILTTKQKIEALEALFPSDNVPFYRNNEAVNENRITPLPPSLSSPMKDQFTLFSKSVASSDEQKKDNHLSTVAPLINRPR